MEVVREEIYFCFSQATPTQCVYNKLSPHHTLKPLYINLVFVFRSSSSPRNPVYVRRVDPSGLDFRLSSHRHSCISFLFSSRFLD
jgi:hypothetical protein